MSKKIKKNIENIIDLSLKLSQLFKTNHVTAYATQAAYFVLLSAIPIVMLGIISIGAIMPFDIIQGEVFVHQFIPEGLQETANRLINEIFNRSNAPLASVTTVFLLWSASKGIRSIGEGIQNIFGSYINSSYIKTAIYSILYTFVFIITIWLSLVILVFAAPLEGLITAALKGRGGVILALFNLRNIIFFIVLTFLFTLAYKSFAQKKITFVQQIPGAAVASAGWILFSFGFSIYIKYFSSYAYLYGSLAAAMIFMLWLFMCMNILLVGALINKLRLEYKGVGLD